MADLHVRGRLLAGGGPSSPDPRVLRALGLPVIGQFDPAFTAIMDDVMDLARRTFLTRNQRCFAVSGTASAGLEAVLNSLIESGDRVAVGGGPRFAAEAAEVATRYGAHVALMGDLAPHTKFVVAPLVDPVLGTVFAVKELASTCHTHGTRLVVEATLGLAGCELRVDDWGIDACVAGADHAVGGPSGMALVTYSPEIEALMHSRQAPPLTNYLDLLQLQAYWSPERLNHHTAPTSLVYGLREALRLVLEEGLDERWRRHRGAGHVLREGLKALGLDVGGEAAFAIVRPPQDVNEAELRHRLLESFGVHVRLIGCHTWRLGLVGADARPDAVYRVLAAVEKVLAQ